MMRSLHFLSFAGFISAFLGLSNSANSQQSFYPIDDYFDINTESKINTFGADFHTNIKPYRRADIYQYTGKDTVHEGHLISYKNENSLYFLNPLIRFEPGLSLSGNQNPFSIDYGFSINGDISDKLSLNFDLVRRHEKVPDYMNDFIKNNDVVPGKGLADSNNFGYATTEPTFYLSYSPGKNFNIQAGRGKNFFGEGYRSLLLSQNSYSYPFLKISTNIWKVKYVNLISNYKDIQEAGGDQGLFIDKYTSTHFISWNVSKRFNLSIFESVVWQDRDSSGVRGLDINYLNPVVFFRPVEFSLGSPDNVLLGLNTRVKIGNNTHLFGQLLLDEWLLAEIRAQRGWSNNKQAFQLGAKSYDFLGKAGLLVHAEFNYIRPYTYSHNRPIQNYAHFNQVVTHPITSNVRELVLITKYQHKDWQFVLKSVNALYGTDNESPDSHVGKDPFKPYPHSFGNFVGQGVKTNLSFNEVRASYLINKNMNLRLEFSLALRSEKTDTTVKNEAFIKAGIRTSINRSYSDF